ncbi:hypothetical protein Tco_1323727 [Tanacetum coccineum]
MNVFMRIDFGSTIKLVSFDEGQVVTFNDRQFSDVEVDCIFDLMELFYFIDEVFDSEYVQVQVTVQQVQNWKHVYASNGEILWVSGTDIQKESQKRPNQARDGKDKVKSKPKSVKVKSQPHEENTS